MARIVGNEAPIRRRSLEAAEGAAATCASEDMDAGADKVKGGWRREGERREGERSEPRGAARDEKVNLARVRLE